MQNEPHVTMASPEPGFRSRVMARIEERERAQARWRAMIGASILVLGVAVVLVPMISWVVEWISMIAHPEAIAPIVMAFDISFGGWEMLFEGIWVAVTAIGQYVGDVPLLAYACVVLVMTAVWVQFVSGSFRRFLEIRIGGL